MATIRTDEPVSIGLGLGLGLVLTNYMFQATRASQRPVREVVICLKCQSRNPAENKFCWQCGTRLQPTPTTNCTKCGATVPLMNYCGNCGNKLRKKKQKQKEIRG